MGSIGGLVAAEEHGIRRSSHWSTVEKHFLASYPSCPACSQEQHLMRTAQNAPYHQTRGLQVHHSVMPFHFCILLGRPDLECDPRNLIVLCEDEQGVKTQDHHITLGHLLNFQSYMPDAAGAAKKYVGKTKDQIIVDKDFGSMIRLRPKAWRDLDFVERQAMRNMLDAKLPRL